MTSPTITPPPATRPDQVSGSPAAFNAAKAAWYAWYQSAMPEIIAMAAYMDAQAGVAGSQATTASSAAVAAAASAVLAAQAQSAAAASAAFKGNWAGLAGALNTPAAVLHNGRVWLLLANLANVATAEPGVHASWASLPMHQLGSDAHQVPANQHLGGMAYQNPEAVVLRPAASAAPHSVGDMVLQLTSNTSLVIKVKGSDGTVRSTTLTLA